MSVRHGLLAILAQGPCYGYQLRQEFDRRTGGTWSLNVGQVYSTLDRLERDGLVETTGTDAEGRAIYAITPAGRAEAELWLATPVVRADRDELAIKLALASTLPGVDALAIISAQRSARTEPATTSPVIEAWLREVAEAEDRWLDAVVVIGSEPIGLSEDAPKRGRPARI